MGVPMKFVIVSLGSFTTDEFQVSPLCLIAASIFNLATVLQLHSFRISLISLEVPYLGFYPVETIGKFCDVLICDRKMWLDLLRPRFYILPWLTSGELCFLDRYSKTIYLSGQRNDWGASPINSYLSPFPEHYISTFKPKIECQFGHRGAACPVGGASNAGNHQRGLHFHKSLNLKQLYCLTKSINTTKATLTKKIQWITWHS